MISTEQQTVVDTILEPDINMVLVSAVAGSGKSYTLVQCASAVKGSSMYLAYNKSAQLEAKEKFDPSVEVKTVDALAYKYIIGMGLSMNGIIAGKRKIDWFGWRNIDLGLSYEEKVQVVEHMEVYFASGYVSLTEFLGVYKIEKNIGDAIILYVKKMAQKEIPCTFGFAKKYLHILLSRGVITPAKLKLLMLDECQDSSAVVLEIFKLLPAEKKIAVGDIHQTIYSFNHCTNGFLYLADQSDKLLKLSTTYRCSEEIAKKIEIFGKKYLDKDLVFRGLPIEDKTINSNMFLARTNGSLIAKMIELNEMNIPYNLTRKAKDIFGLLLTIISLKPGCKIYQPQYKFLMQDMQYFYKNPALKERGSLLKYIMSEHHEDKSIQTAAKTIIKYGGSAIFKAFEIAKVHEEAKVTHKTTLSSVHAAKGLESDKVILAEDLFPDYLVENERELTEEEIDEELRLVYVAVSRARVELIGANWLTTI